MELLFNKLESSQKISLRIICRQNKLIIIILKENKNKINHWCDNCVYLYDFSTKYLLI